MTRKIRSLREHDVSAVATILSEAVDARASSHYGAWTDERVKRFLTAPPQFEAYIVEDEDDVIGCAALTRHHEREAYSRTAELTLHVRPRARRSGAGRELAELVLERGRKLGLHSIVVLVPDGPGVQFATRFGFNHSYRLPGVYASRQEWRDIVALQLMLGESRPCTELNADDACMRPARIIPHQSPNIRRASPDDADELARIYNQAMKVGIFATSDVQPVDRENRVMWLSHHSDEFPAFVYEDNGRVLAWCSLSPFSLRPEYPGVAESSRYVDEQYRDRGIGKEMVGHLVTVATELGYRALVTLVFSRNLASIRSANAFGFNEVGRFREVAILHDEWLDVSYLYKSLV